jgi:hypothetical protein
MLEKVTTAADRINTVVDSEFYAAGQGVSQSLTSPPGHPRRTPDKGRIKVYVRDEKYPHYSFHRLGQAASTRRRKPDVPWWAATPAVPLEDSTAHST